LAAVCRAENGYCLQTYCGAIEKYTGVPESDVVLSVWRSQVGALCIAQPGWRCLRDLASQMGGCLYTVPMG